MTFRRRYVMLRKNSKRRDKDKENQVGSTCKKLSQPGFCLFCSYLNQTSFLKECDPIAVNLVVIVLKFLSIHAGGNLG